MAPTASTILGHGGYTLRRILSRAVPSTYHHQTDADRGWKMEAMDETMDVDQLKPKQWYWVRRIDGSVAAYQFHRVRRDPETRAVMADFYVGSLIQSWPLGRVMAEAGAPERGDANGRG